jgi:hypothetical protein
MFRLALALLAVAAMALGVGEHWLTSRDLAERYQVPLSTVRYWRLTGTGPRGVLFRSHVRYDPAEVRRWEREMARAERERQEAGEAS